MQIQSFLLSATVSMLCVLNVAASPTENVARLEEVNRLVDRWASPDPQFCDIAEVCSGCAGVQCHIIKRKIMDAMNDIPISGRPSGAASFVRR